MRRISTDADYLRDGTVTLDADGIPLEWSSKADNDYVDSQDQALGQRIDGLHHYQGEGFPEGKVAAPVGSIYTDRQATAGAVRWIKTSGTGNIGWQVEYGNTGVRNITSLIPATVISGNLYLARSNDTIWITFDELRLEDASTSWHLWNGFLPAGFYPTTAGFYYSALPARNTNYTSGPLRLSGSQMTIYETRGQKMISGVIPFPAPAAWPSTRPGTPA